MDFGDSQFAKLLDEIVERKVKTIIQREIKNAGIVCSWTATVVSVDGADVTVKLPGDAVHTLVKKNKTGVALIAGDEVYLFSPFGGLTNAFIIAAKNK